MIDDFQAWEIVKPQDLWVFDKLLLSKRLGYSCGPKGTSVPNPAKYIVRPCVNLLGMSRGAKIITLRGNTEYHIPDGFFWCEIFTGKHLSIDYSYGKQVLCVEGSKKASQPLQRWAMWKKVGSKPKLPRAISELLRRYEYGNIEMIGNRVIEVHLRHNPDFADHNSSYVIPVYKDEEIKPRKNQEFIMAPDEERLGFYIEKT